MDLKNKIFRDNRTGEEIRVIDSFENIAILENKEKMDARRLMNPMYYTEQIDPKSFFNNQGAYNSLAEKIRSIPMENVRDDEGGSTFNVKVDDNYGIKPALNESAVIMSSEDEERAELARKYGAIMDNTESLRKQNESLSKFMDEDDIPQVTSIIQQPVAQNNDQIQRVEVNRDGVQQVINEPVVRIDDPIISMFKNVKRVVDFSVTLDVKNKIPRLDFIEMMEDSYETSIIDFLSEEMAQNLLKNPHILRNMISEKIKEMVYKNKPTEKKVEKVKVVKPKAPRKSTKKVIPPPPPPPPARLLKEGEIMEYIIYGALPPKPETE